MHFDCESQKHCKWLAQAIAKETIIILNSLAVYTIFLNWAAGRVKCAKWWAAKKPEGKKKNIQNYYCCMANASHHIGAHNTSSYASHYVAYPCIS